MKTLFKNNNKIENGFISITFVIITSSLLLVFTYMQLIEVGHFFDQTMTKEYRLMNYYNAYSCIDQAILRLSQDYFFTTNIPIYISDMDCSINSVMREGDIVDILAQGEYKKIIVKRQAKVRMFDNKLEIISISK